jgi:hypothetical protein
LARRTPLWIDFKPRLCTYNRIPKPSTTQRSIPGRHLPLPERTTLARNTQGEIPISHFENEPTYPAKNVSPLSKEWLDKIAAVKANTGTDKYKPSDFVGGY